MALLSEQRRLCSVVADTFCFVYILYKTDLNEILLDYPDLKKMLSDEGNKRRRESMDNI